MFTLIFKNLTRRRTRTLLTAVGIAIGVAMIVALGAMGEGLRTGYMAMFAGSGADLTLMRKGSFDVTMSAVDQEIIAQVKTLPQVSEAAGMVVGNVTAPGIPYFYVFGYDLNSFAIGRFKIVEGQPLGATRRTASGQREILLGKKAAEVLKLKPGDVVRLTGGAFRIVGIYETGAGFEDAASVMALADAQQLVQKQRQVSAVQIKLKDARQVEPVRARLERMYPRLMVSQSSQVADQQQMVSMMQGFAWGIAFLAVIIGGIGMTNTVMMSTFERTREIGALRALGWGRRRIVLMVLGESVLLSVAGGLVGCAAGAAMIGPLGQSPAMGYLQGTITWPLVGQGLLTAVVLGGVGGLYPAWWASRLLPVEAMRYESGAVSNTQYPVPPIQSGIGYWVWDTWKTLWRRRGRTALTVIGVSLGLAAVVALGGMADGFVREFTRMAMAGDVDLVARQAGASDMGYSAIDERIGRQIAAMPGVQSVSGMLINIVDSKEIPMFIVMGYNPQERAIRHFKIVAGRGLVGNREIILGRPAAEALKVGIGDVIRLGEVGFRVVGLFETGIAWEEGGGVISLRDAQALAGKPRQVSFYGIKLNDPQQAKIIQKQIEAAIPEVAVAPSSEFTESLPDMQNTYALMWAISGLAIIVGGVGMMNTMFMSVFERTREIGVLRALGWRRRRVLAMILRESLALSLPGMAAGVLLSLVLGVLMRQIPVWGSWLVIVFSPGLLAQALIVAIGLGAVGGLYPAWRAAQLSPVEALRYE